MHTATVGEKKELAPNILLVRMDLAEDLLFRPGQHIVLKIPADGEKIDRPFSIASSPSNPRRIDIVVRLVSGGVASTFLQNCGVGDRIQFEGPQGTFGAREGNRPLCFVASGTGIAPFRSMLPGLLEQEKRLALFFVVPSPGELFFHEELQALARSYPNLRYVPVVSNPHHLSYFRTFDLDMGADFYLCGGFHFVRDIAKLLGERGVEQRNINFEEFK